MAVIGKTSKAMALLEILVLLEGAFLSHKVEIYMEESWKISGFLETYI